MLDLVSCAGGPALALLAAIVTHSNRRVGCEWIRLDPPRPAAAHWAPAGGDGIVRLGVDHTVGPGSYALVGDVSTFRIDGGDADGLTKGLYRLLRTLRVSTPACDASLPAEYDGAAASRGALG